MADERLIVALDHPDLDTALRLVDALGERVAFYKVGLTLYAAAGHAAVEALRRRKRRIFLDLKLHDIPAQVEGAVAAVARLGVDLLTVHTAGGREMLEGAARGARGGTVRLLGVTVLTSQTATLETVATRASEALDAGIDGVVSSPLEVVELRRRFGPGPLIVTPGVRLAATGVEHDDQMRVATPAAALNAGASHLVVGRPITRAADPVRAAEAILESMQSRLAAGGAANG